MSAVEFGWNCAIGCLAAHDRERDARSLLASATATSLNMITDMFPDHLWTRNSWSRSDEAGETQEHSLPPANQEIAGEQDVNCWGVFIDLHKGAKEVAASRFIVVSDSFRR